MKNLLRITIIALTFSGLANAQGAEIAREIRNYMNAETSDEMIEVKDKAGKTHYVRSAATTTTHHIGGQNTSTNTVVFDAFNAHPEWQNMNVVVDWTGSMYSYVGQVVRWHHVNKDKQLMNSMVLFNDGDDKLRQGRSGKTIGSTGGIYFPNHLDIDSFLNTVATAVDNGGGGDGPENDVEAIIAAQAHDQSGSDFVLIADATSIRDISLVHQIKRPVHVILCDHVSPDYITLARTTGGSITWPGGYTDYSQVQCTTHHVTVCNHHHSHDMACHVHE